MQEITLLVQVKAKNEVSPEMVAKAVQRLINLGVADSFAALEDGNNIEVEESKLAMDLNITAPVVAPNLDASTFVEQVAGLSIWGYDRNDGTPYEECEEPDEGHMDSHECLMTLIEDARRIIGSEPQ